jgi:hypothetical protein
MPAAALQVFLSMLKGEYHPQDHPPVIYAQEFWREKLQQQAAVLQQQLEQQQHSSAEREQQAVQPEGAGQVQDSLEQPVQGQKGTSHHLV